MFQQAKSGIIKKALARVSRDRGAYMEYDIDEHKKLWAKLEVQLKKNAKTIVFLELNKDIFREGIKVISRNLPIPARREALLDGIKKNNFSENIESSLIIESMAYIIGSDRDFKYNSSYMSILEQWAEDARSIISNSAYEALNNNKYIDALIYFIALHRIFTVDPQYDYDIANTLRELAQEAEKKGRMDSFELFYKLSFYEFFNLSREYSGFPMANYVLGFYYVRENQYDSALTEWKTVHETAKDPKLKDEASKLSEGLVNNMELEKGKGLISGGDVHQGLSVLIPLMEKYNDWSEVKYYIALGFRMIRNYKKAELLLAELLSSGENFPEIYSELGMCYFNTDELQKAVDCFGTAVHLDGENPAYLCNLGIACYESGDVLKAREFIDKAYKIDPDDEVTRKCKLWMNSAEN